MKILFVSDNFPPEVNAPASRTYEHARRWVTSGADVTVITCAPNFPKGEVHEGYTNAWRSVEEVDGIRVVRVKTMITGNEGFAMRILDYVSFMVSATFFGLFEKRPDIIVGTSPQFFAAFGAWALSVLKWRPFVFELRDLWPASIVTVGAMKRGIAIRFLEKVELFLYRRARLIVSVTQSFVEDLAARGIDRKKIHVVRNSVDLSLFSQAKRSDTVAREFGVEGKFVIAYLGTHGMAHDLGNVLRAAERLQDRDDIVFLFVGHGAEKQVLLDLANDLQLRNVRFCDSVPKERMPDVWGITDVALVHLKDDPVFSTVIPSKIFEAFGVGKPILIVQPDGEAADLVREAGAGEWVAPNDPEELATTVVRWRRDPDQLAEYAAGASRASQENSRDARAAEMLRILQSAT